MHNEVKYQKTNCKKSNRTLNPIQLYKLPMNISEI